MPSSAAPKINSSYRAGDDPEASKPGQLQCGASEVEAENGAEKVELESLDPADCYTDITSERNIDPCAGRRHPNPSTIVRESFPTAVGGKTAPSSGTESRAACTKIFEFGPGQGL